MQGSLPVPGKVQFHPDLSPAAFRKNIYSRNKFRLFYPQTDESDDSVNFTMRFLDYEEYTSASLAAIGDGYTDGYSSIWFRGGEITDAEIGVCNDLSRTNKNHVILEEIIQALGLQNDTYDYPESLFYQGYNEPQWPCELDWFLIRFLYHPELAPMMKEPLVRMTAELIITE